VENHAMLYEELFFIIYTNKKQNTGVDDDTAPSTELILEEKLAIRNQ